MSFPRPQPGEMAEYYVQYADLVPEGDFQSVLAQQTRDTHALLSGMDEERALHRYATGKWSAKEVLGHIIDSERIFANRALCFLRNDPAPQPGFDQDHYITQANFDARSWTGIVEEFLAVRNATQTLFGSVTPETATRGGTANEVPCTAGAAAYIIAGHALHHRRVIEERYLK